MATKASRAALAAASKIDASGNLEADTLDGVDSLQFTRSDQADTLTEALTIDPTTNGIMAFKIGAGTDSSEYYSAYLQASDDNVSTGFNIQRRSQIGSSNQQRITAGGIVSMNQNWNLWRYYSSAYTSAMEMNHTNGDIDFKNNVGIGTTTPLSNLNIKETGIYNFIQMEGAAGQYTGLKLSRGAGDWSSITNNNFGIVVTDGGLEFSRFTSLGDNTTGRAQLVQLGSRGQLNVGGMDGAVVDVPADGDARLQIQNKSLPKRLGLINYFRNGDFKETQMPPQSDLSYVSIDTTTQRVSGFNTLKYDIASDTSQYRDLFGWDGLFAIRDINHRFTITFWAKNNTGSTIAIGTPGGGGDFLAAINGDDTWRKYTLYNNGLNQSTYFECRSTASAFSTGALWFSEIMIIDGDARYALDEEDYIPSIYDVATGIVNDTDPTTGDAYFRSGFDGNGINTGIGPTTTNLAGSYSFTTSSKIGPQALDFGTSQSGYCDLVTLPATNNFSMGGWFYIHRANTVQRSYIVDFRTSNSGAGYWLFDNLNSMTIKKNDAEFIFSHTIPTGQWVHWVIVSDFSGSTTKFYENGVLVQSSTPYIDTLSTTCTLGTYYNSRGGSGQYFMNAIVDNFFVSETAYSAEQVSQIYNSTVDY